MDFDVYRNRYFKKNCRDLLAQIVMKRPEPALKQESAAEEQGSPQKNSEQLGAKAAGESETQKFEAEVRAGHQYQQTKAKLGNLESRFIELTNEGRTIVRDCAQLKKDLENSREIVSKGLKKLCSAIVSLASPSQNLFMPNKARERSRPCSAGLSGGDEIALNNYPLVETALEATGTSAEDPEVYVNLFNMLKQLINPNSRVFSDYLTKKTRFNLGARGGVLPGQQLRLAPDEAFASLPGFDEEPKMIQDLGKASPVQPLLQKAESYGFLDSHLSKRKISVLDAHQGLSEFESLYPVDLVHSRSPKALYAPHQPSKRLVSPGPEAAAKRSPQLQPQEENRFPSNSPYLSAFEWDLKSLQDSHDELHHDHDIQMIDRIGLQNSPSVGSRDRKLSY